MSALPEETIESIARWLAPYVAAELAKTPAPLQERGVSYDPATCTKFVRELGQGVLNRSADFFSRLAAEGHVGSLELAELIGTSSPRNIPANLTNSLKQRARRMQLDVPWDETVSEENRTVWLDRDGIAARMVEAIRAEQQRRFGGRPGR